MKQPNKKELLKMPSRKWAETKRLYNQILLVPSGLKHDSGYMRIAIIGVYREDEKEKYEICGWPDDVSCHFPLLQLERSTFPKVRMDCWWPSGVLQYHSSYGKFKVSESLSSQDIYFIEKP